MHIFLQVRTLKLVVVYLFYKNKRRVRMRIRSLVVAVLSGSLAVLSQLSASETIVQKFPLPTDLPAFNTCANEGMLVNGDILLVVRNTTDGQGRIHISYHEQLINLVGIGVDSGNVYRIVGRSQQVLPPQWTNIFLPQIEPEEGMGPIVLHKTVMTQFVEVGRVENRGRNFFHVTAHITVNAKGKVVVENYGEPKVVCY